MQETEWKVVEKKKSDKPPHLRKVEGVAQTSQSVSSFATTKIGSGNSLGNNPYQKGKFESNPQLKSGYTNNYQKNTYKSKTDFKNSKSNYKNTKKRVLVDIPDFNSPEEQENFETLKNTCPHLMMPGEIRRYAQKENIDLFAEQMLSDEWIAYQQEGWVFVRVIKPDDNVEDIPDGDGYDVRPLDNKWGDIILFKRLELDV